MHLMAATVDEAVAHLITGAKDFSGAEVETTSELIPGETGVYTVWSGADLLYVGCVVKKASETSNPQADGIKGRLRTQSRAKRINSVVALRVCDRFIVPELSPRQLEGLRTGATDLDALTAHWMRENLRYKVVHTASGDLAREVEALLRRDSGPLGPPLLNPS